MSMKNYRERMLRRSADTGGAGAPPASVPPAGTPIAQPPAGTPEPIPDISQLPPLPVAAGHQEDWQTSMQQLLDRQGQILASAEEDQKRRQGADKALGKRIPALETKYDDLSAKLDKLLTLSTGDSETPPATPPPSKPKPESPTGTTEDNAVDDELYNTVLEVKDENQELRAIINRDRIIREVSQPGQPGAGMNLWAAADNIPLRPPVMKDGQLDDSAQRVEIDRLIKYVAQQTQATAKGAQQAIMQGATPGSQAPQGAPGDAVGETAELSEIWTRLNDPNELAKMDQSEFDRLVSRQDELGSHMGEVTTGYRQPFPNLEAVLGTLQSQMAGVMAQIDYSGPPGLPPPG